MADRLTRHRSLRFGTFEAVVVLAFAVAGVVAWRSRAHAKETVSREERALATARRVVEAERTFRAERRRDADGDGTGEYGALDALVASGLVEGPLLRDDDAQFVERDGYRFEVLLPARVTPKGRKEWSRSSGPVDPRLAASTFAVVALPMHGGPPALRAFYLDGLGYGYSVDGVYAVDRNPSPPPPLFELRGGDKGDDGGLDGGPAWRPFEKPAGVPLAFSEK